LAQFGSDVLASLCRTLVAGLGAIIALRVVRVAFHICSNGGANKADVICAVSATIAH